MYKKHDASESTSLRVGVDDCGSGAFRGYACVIVSADGAQYLEARAKELLSSVPMKHFHGREFNPGCPRQVKAYECFSMAIRETLETGGEYAAFNLLHRSVYKELFDKFSRHVAENAFQGLMQRVPEFCISKAGAMFWLSRCLSRLIHMGDAMASVEIDQDQPGDGQAGGASIGLHGTVGALHVPASDALVRLANAYKCQMFPEGPSIEALRVCASADSILVQAADLLANFGVATLRVEIMKGAVSSERDRVRAKIFKGMMPEQVVALAESLSLNDRGELEGITDESVLLELAAFSPQ